MARYKPYNLKQDKFIPIAYADQILPGSFEHTLNELVEHQLLRVFDEAMKRKIDSVLGRLIYGQRIATVEPVFGNMQNKGMRRFTLRSKRKVDTQWKLFAMTHNIEKIGHYPTG